ncbi:MAG: YybS family protein [Sporomusaceae bacterium]|nr:YybS family protein [Sporomusaceae bacterium]
MHQPRVKPMVESGILAAVAILFAIISAYVPVLGAFVNIIWPVPLVLLGVRHGHRWSVMATVVAGLIIAMLLHPLQAVSVVAGFALTGIALGYCIRSGMGVLQTLAWGSLASLVSKLAVIGISIVVMGVNPFNFQEDTMVEVLNRVVGIYRSFGMSEEDLGKMTEMMKTTLSVMKVILPAGFAVAAVFETWLNFTIARSVLRKLGHHFQPFLAFKYWSVPYATIYVWAAASGIALLSGLYQYELLSKISVNIQILATVVLLCQGLALFYFLAEKYNLSRFVRNIILILVLTNGILTQVVMFAGAFDLIFDYRKLKESRPT